MSMFKVRAAIFAAIDGLDVGVPVLRANEKKPENTTRFAEAYLLPNAPEPVTMGALGEDRITGILQINVNVPLHEGDGKLLQLADTFTEAFKVGLDLTYDGQKTTFFGGGVDGFQESNGFFQAILSFEFQSQYRR